MNDLDDLTTSQKEYLVNQMETAELLGLELDPETAEIVIPEDDPTPQWMKNYRDKLDQQDNNPSAPEQANV